WGFPARGLLLPDVRFLQRSQRYPLSDSTRSRRSAICAWMGLVSIIVKSWWEASAQEYQRRHCPCRTTHYTGCAYLRTESAMPIDRRAFLKLGGLTLAGAAPGLLHAGNVLTMQPAEPLRPADHTLRIGRSVVELAPDNIVSTRTYNGQFPGPLLRLKQGRSVVVDVHNDTDTPEQLHWHGQTLPAAVDGAAEEGTPYIPAHGMRRIAFVPGPAGLRSYHTHVRAGDDLDLGQYGGLVGPVYIEPPHESGAWDREVFLTLKEFDPFFSKGGDMAMDFLQPDKRDPLLQRRGETAMKASLADGAPHGYEVGYQSFSINGRMLGHGE